MKKGKRYIRAAETVGWLLILLLLSACGKENAETAVSGNTEAAKTAERTMEQGNGEEVRQQAALQIPGFNKKAMLQKLEPELLLDFMHLYTSTGKFEEKCDLPVPVSGEQANLLMGLLHTECPELFQYDAAAKFGMEMTEDKVIALSVPYGMDQAVYEERMKYCLQRISDFKERALSLADPYEQEMIIYRLLCELVVYNKEYARSGDASGALVEGSAKCDGISLAFKWLMDELDIPCIVVPGDSRDPENSIGHAWNLVKPGEKWRLVDVTQDTVGERTGDSLMYPLYNTTDAWEEKTYEIPAGVRELGIPSCIGMEDSFHVKNRSYYPGTSAQEGFFTALERALSENGSAYVQYETAEAWEEFRTHAEEWTNAWMQEKGLYGHTSYTSMDDFLVAQIVLEINENSQILKELEEQINTKQREIEAAGNSLNAEAAELEKMQEKLDCLREEAEALSSGGMQSMDADTAMRYNSLVEQYNTLLEKYTQRAQEYELGVNGYETAREEYNVLVNSFNAMAK